MKYRALIRRGSDGVERWTEHDDVGIGPEVVEYMWMDGNYACDCNRADFFARAGAEPEPDPAAECGGNAYSLLRIEREDGYFLADIMGPDVCAVRWTNSPDDEETRVRDGI